MHWQYLEDTAIDFDLSAVTIDPGFKENDYSYLENLCARLDIPCHIEKTRIAEYILSVNSGTPCAKCAHSGEPCTIYEKEWF